MTVHEQPNDVYINTIETNGWHAYDITPDVLAGGVLREYEELEVAGRALAVEIGHHYLLAPTPKRGQTVRQANEMVQGVGPSIEIGGNSSDYVGLHLMYVPNLAMFTRITKQEDGVGLYSPELLIGRQQDTVILDPGVAENVFARDFRITPISQLKQRIHEYRR